MCSRRNSACSWSAWIISQCQAASLKLLDVSEVDKDRSFNVLSLRPPRCWTHNTSRSAPNNIGAMTILYYPMGGAVSALTVIGLCMCVEKLCLPQANTLIDMLFNGEGEDFNVRIYQFALLRALTTETSRLDNFSSMSHRTRGQI